MSWKCATICLDHSGTDLCNRVANKVYEFARSGKCSLQGFPDITPMVQSLKQGATVERTKSYRVTTQQHDRLVVLKSLAEKWLAEESTRDTAKITIDEHNKKFNPSGEYMASDRTALCVLPPPLEPAPPNSCNSFWPSCRNDSREESKTAAAAPPAKRIKLEETTEQHISKLVKPSLVFNIVGWRLLHKIAEGLTQCFKCGHPYTCAVMCLVCWQEAAPNQQHP